MVKLTHEDYLELDDMLYSNPCKTVELINKTDKAELLHFFVLVYNWHFYTCSVPMAIIENKACDLGTAINLFNKITGKNRIFPTDYFDEYYNPNESKNIKWESLISELYQKIKNRNFKTKRFVYSKNWSLNLGEFFKEEFEFDYEN